MAKSLRFKNTDVPRQNGELARFKVAQGPDLGAIYIVVSPTATIGRGEDSDIQLADLKTSRLHAEVSLTTAGWRLKDLGSANGVLLNNNKIREEKLKFHDIIALGETLLEFTPSDSGTQVLTAPAPTLAKIQENQRRLEENKARLKPVGLAALFKTPPAQGQQAPAQSSNRKPLILIAVLAVLGVVFFMPEENTGKKPATKSTSKKGAVPSGMQDLEAFLPQIAGAETVTRSAAAFFKDGFREYQAANYSRAKVQFETVLQIAPGHQLATLYLENCQQAIDTEVKMHFEYGRKSYSAGKLRIARGHFERILRLLYKEQTSENYTKAKELYEKVERDIRGVPKSEQAK